jgi:tRNA acetyltransferase TAN1
VKHGRRRALQPAAPAREAGEGAVKIREGVQGAVVEKGPTDFNFIATTYKGLEREAMAECLTLLRRLGDGKPVATATEVIGLLLGRTLLDPLTVVRGLREMVAEDPWSVRLVLRFIPIEEVAEAKPEAVREGVASLSAKVPESDSFRVTVEKRHNETPSTEFVEAAAAAMKQKVNLDSPDWVVLVEVVGRMAGISIVRPDSIFSSQKARRGE